MSDPARTPAKIRAEADLVRARASCAESASVAAHNLGTALSGLAAVRGSIDTYASPGLAADLAEAASEAVAALRRVVAAVELAPPPAAGP